MALVRPPKSNLKQELGQETSLETTILTQLESVMKAVNEVKDGQSSLTVMLFGGMDRGIPFPGKVTAAEKRQEEHEVRIASLEADRTKLRAVARTAAVFGSLIGAITATGVTLLFQYLIRAIH